MKFNSMLVAAASALLAGTAMAGSAAYPGDDLGSLTPLPALYGDLKSTSLPGGASFLDSFTFSIGGKSDVTGSVSEFFGSVSFAGISIDGLVPTLITTTPTGVGFSFSGLAAGSHTLYVAGSIPKGGSAYIGSVYATPAVPEPESLALVLAGLGMAGSLARRRGKK